MLSGIRPTGTPLDGPSSQRLVSSHKGWRKKPTGTMTKRFGAVSIAYSLGIGLSALIIAPSAHSQSADLALCDRVAADPSDPDKPADVRGVREIAQSDVATAIKFCRVASATSRRALFQLGRAYAANQQFPEAISAYHKAADKGSTSAMVELGVLLATGSGVAKDPAQATRLFERALDAGNPRGAINLVALALSDSGGTPSDLVKARALLVRAADCKFSRSAVSARIDDGGGHRRAEGRCCRAGPVWKGGRAKSRRGTGADGHICPKRARRTEGFKRRQSLLRESRGAR
jgi:Sel1 repeat